MKIIGTDELYLNDTFKALTDILVLHNAPRTTNSEGKVEAIINERHPSVTPQLVLGWVAYGGEVEGFPAYIQMTETKYQGNVPEGIRGRVAYDEDGNSDVLTWQQWADQYGRTFNKIGTKQYVQASDGREYLNGSELVTLGTGYAVLSFAEYNAILPEVTIDE